jgi:hypothetical protein
MPQPASSARAWLRLMQGRNTTATDRGFGAAPSVDLEGYRFVNSTLNSLASIGAPEDGGTRTRTSAILRGILVNNPDVKTFSVECILASIGAERFEASLMMFSIPAIIPVPRPNGMVAVPTGAIACQLAAGRKQITLPAFILQKSVSRKALAVAIHAILPVLEAAERIVRPRWSWISHAFWRRAVGCLVFLLAVAIAYPLSGFSALHAWSIFAVAFGMAEQDGLAVMIGVVAGVLSLAVLAASGMSVRAVRARIGKSLRKLGRKLGLAAVARFLERLGYKMLARLCSFQWSELLLLWDPEARPARDSGAVRRAAGEARALPERGALQPSALLLARGGQPVQRSGVPGVH